MARPVTLFTDQWTDLPLEELAKKAASWDYDGLELFCWGNHFMVDKALEDDVYCKAKREMLKKLGLEVFTIQERLAINSNNKRPCYFRAKFGLLSNLSSYNVMRSK